MRPVEDQALNRISISKVKKNPGSLGGASGSQQVHPKSITGTENGRS